MNNEQKDLGVIMSTKLSLKANCTKTPTSWNPTSQSWEWMRTRLYCTSDKPRVLSLVYKQNRNEKARKSATQSYQFDLERLEQKLQVYTRNV